MKKCKKMQKDLLFQELVQYRKEGIPLWLDGTPSTPKEICKAHQVAEQISYMRDYVEDEEGKLSRLEFFPIKKY